MLLYFLLMFIIIGYGSYKSEELCGSFTGYKLIDKEHYNCCSEEIVGCVNNNEGGCYWKKERVCRGYKIK